MNPVKHPLHSCLAEYASRNPRQKLLGDGRGWLSAARTVEAVAEKANLLRRIGIHRGDYVALRSYRNVETSLWILALQRLGAVAVLTDPRHDIREYLSRCAAAPDVTAQIDGGEVTVLRPTEVRGGEPSAREPTFVIFTSGSTGQPKAVMLSQYNLVNNLVDSQPLGHYCADDIALGALPLDHVFGLVLLAGVCVLGYGLYFPERTDVSSLLSCIESERITRMNGVPGLYLAMAEQAQHYDLSSLRAGFIGGAPYTPEQFRRMEAALDMTLIPVYGMSECIGIACGDWRDDADLRAACVGKIYSMNTCKILLPDGSEAAAGQAGEIWVTGPARMAGYYPHRIPEGELLPTGDLGFLDEQGYLHITGRKKDIIIRNGINLSPKPIEEALLSIPGVNAACVVGMPHPVQGEVPWALVVSDRTAGELLELLPGLLPKNQIPFMICVGEQLPMTGSGKIDKNAVREVLKQWNP